MNLAQFWMKKVQILQKIIKNKKEIKLKIQKKKIPTMRANFLTYIINSKRVNRNKILKYNKILHL